MTDADQMQKFFHHIPLHEIYSHLILPIVQQTNSFQTKFKVSEIYLATLHEVHLVIIDGSPGKAARERHQSDE
jgi:hypothetical protein